MQAPFLIHFEQTMWTKDLSYGWKEPKTFVILFFSNEQSSVRTNLIKKAQQHKLLMKIWMTLKIQQKKLPPKLKENSSPDGFKAAHGWIMIKKNNSMKCSLANIPVRISCDDFSLLWKLHVWRLFCAVFVILKSTPCLISKERGKQNISFILEKQTLKLEWLLFKFNGVMHWQCY